MDTSSTDTRFGLTSAEYRRHYDAGWNASGGNPRATAPMDVAEDRYLRRTGEQPGSPAHDAWQDGWLDYATDRERYHFETCDGTCGEH